MKIGDKITFRAVTRSGASKATRVINGFYMGQPTVRFHGWSNFVVRLEEVIK